MLCTAVYTRGIPVYTAVYSVHGYTPLYTAMHSGYTAVYSVQCIHRCTAAYTGPTPLYTAVYTVHSLQWAIQWLYSSIQWLPLYTAVFPYGHRGFIEEPRTALR